VGGRCMKHNKWHDEGSNPWPETNLSGSMHTEAGKGALQDHERYYRAMSHGALWQGRCLLKLFILLRSPGALLVAAAEVVLVEMLHLARGAPAHLRSHCLNRHTLAFLAPKH
jgi:hypothetical protein